MHGQPGFIGMEDITTECSFDSQATCIIAVLGLFVDMLSMGVSTISHWRTSGRLVQQLDVCTVGQVEMLI